ncbi:hypothetical protein [Sandaracinus amylolyticus]|uniref:hypothetical protein n=1 Tax=Sandaracinus amylolyticus TaxID=927083 RepID=UPI001F2B980B|nr:hypothetical protein [Sandaracinus amylolyticus]UJR79865.1 Hypothetical protein I5071_19040 [Sandaracinus amylolyticus]
MRPNLPSERYALLVQQLGEERNFAHGWKVEVATLLDVHPTYVAKVHAGERTNIGNGVIERAIQGLRLDPAFFTRESVGGSYREHVRPDHPAHVSQVGRAEAFASLFVRDIQDDLQEMQRLIRASERSESDPNGLHNARPLAEFLVFQSRMARYAQRALAEGASVGDLVSMLMYADELVQLCVSGMEHRAELHEKRARALREQLRDPKAGDPDKRD